MILSRAYVLLRWNNGETINIGTIEISADETKIEKGKFKNINRKIGWEMVKRGFALMLMKKQTATEYADVAQRRRN